MTHKTAFDFDGARLEIEADDERWPALWNRVLPEFETPHMPGARTFKVTMRTVDTPRIDHDLPLTYAGPQPDRLQTSIFEEGERLVHLVEDAVALDVDHAAGVARVELRADAAKAMAGSAMMQLVDAGAGFFGRYLIHAAALVHPETGRAVLLSARSGGGKTTTTLALAHAGFALLTDDATILGFVDGVPTVWGLPRSLKVHRRTAELLPWVGPLPDRWDDEGEQPVTYAALGDRITVGRQGAPLGAIIELGARSNGAHRLRAQPRPAALVALAHENVAGRALGITPRARRRFEALGRAVSLAKTLTLSAGTELESLPALIGEATA